MIFALPTQTIQAFLAIHKLGWKPRIFVNSVSIDPFVMDVVQKNTGKKLVEGAISSQFLKDPTDPALARDPGVKLYKLILRRYLPGAKVKEVAHLYGWPSRTRWSTRCGAREPSRRGRASCGPPRT
jgi:hypothetical protein